MSEDNKEKEKRGDSTNAKLKMGETVNAVIYRKTVRDGVKVEDRIEV